MANINYTTVERGNKVIEDNILQAFNDAEITNDKKGIWVRERGNAVHEKLVELSKELPEITIKALHSLGIDQYSKSYTVEYRAGNSEVMDLQLNYWFEIFTPPQGFTRKQVEDKITEFYYKFDKVVKDKDGGFRVHINNISLPVSIDLGKKYRVEALKEHHVIYVKIFEKVVTWREIENKIDIEDIM